ncbi:MAG: DUF6766 family protein [Pseudomonadota bacterium]
MSKVLRDNGLTIALIVLFLGSLIGHFLTGWHVQNEQLRQHGEAAISLGQYAVDPHFISTVFENWESEFLQMSAYVVLTAFLFQKGSAESKDPDDGPRDGDLAQQALRSDAPRILRRTAVARWIYSRSLGLALFALFLISFTAHWLASAREAAAEANSHGQVALSAWEYLGDPQLWFESFQNWQSEFLSTAVLVVLSIFLRQRESPESKAVAAPHSQTGAD